MVDKTLKEKMSQDDLDNLIELLKSEFKSGQYYSGLSKTINILQEKILHFFPDKLKNSNTENELPNTIIWGDFST